MEPLVVASLWARRWARVSGGLLVMAALSAYVVRSGSGPIPSSAGLLAVAYNVMGAVALVVGMLFGVALLRRKLRGEASQRRGRAHEPSLGVDVQLGALLALLVVWALVRVDGNLSGPFSPSLFVFVALVAACLRPVAALLVVAFLLVIELAIRASLSGTVGATSAGSLEPIAVHAAFIASFALLHVASLRAEIARIRRRSGAELERELGRLKEDARRYRLSGGAEEEASEAAREERTQRSSVEEIHQSVHYALDLLRRTLDLHTAVLLWLNDAGTHLRISELSTSSDDIQDAPFSAGDGVLGAVIARRERVSLRGLKPSYKIPYYAGAHPVRALTALPVMEGDQLRGILALDRAADAPFSPHEEELAARAARYCLRAIQNERVFVQLERAKVEQGKLYRAAKSLGAALSEVDVLDAGVKAAREIASFDLAVVTLWDDKAKMHEVRAASAVGDEGPSATSSSDGVSGVSVSDVKLASSVVKGERGVSALVGARFAPNAGLVSMVVQNRFPLPYKGDFDASHQVVLAKRHPWPKMPSLLVLPLVTHDRVLGTLILGARRRHAFGDTVRPTLEVLASHLAVSLANARMVQALETMATTDGLTGLLNKRAMLDQAEQKVRAAARFGRQLSVLVTDIDHFKRVNDTYGHDVGDKVIKGLGQVLLRHKRATDVVARFGGEEFVVLCEQTDPQGAMLLAERIREELQKTVFTSDNGEFSVTCSIGITTFPEGGADWDALFKSADEALYVSKNSGRNRSTASSRGSRRSVA
jgi:two-component system cell cycle response regulator